MGIWTAAGDGGMQGLCPAWALSLGLALPFGSCRWPVQILFITWPCLCPPGHAWLFAQLVNHGFASLAMICVPVRDDHAFLVCHSIPSAKFQCLAHKSRWTMTWDGYGAWCGICPGEDGRKDHRGMSSGYCLCHCFSPDPGTSGNSQGCFLLWCCGGGPAGIWWEEAGMLLTPCSAWDAHTQDSPPSPKCQECQGWETSRFSSFSLFQLSKFSEITL